MGISSKVTSNLNDALKAPTSKAKAVAYGSAVGLILGEALGTNASPIARASSSSAVSALGSGISILGKRQVYQPKNTRINSAGGGKGHGDELDKVEAEREKMLRSKVKNGKSGPLSSSKDGDSMMKGVMLTLGTQLLEKAVAGIGLAAGFIITKAIKPVIGALWSAAKGSVKWIAEKMWGLVSPVLSFMKNKIVDAAKIAGRGVASVASKVGGAALTFGRMGMGAITAGGAGSMALAGAAVAGAGYLGYKAGGMINEGINAGISAISDGEYSSLGDVIYELVEGTLGTELKEKFLAWGSELWTTVSTKVSSFASEYLLDPLTNWFTKTVPAWFETLLEDFKGMMSSGFTMVSSHVKDFVGQYVMSPIIKWWNGVVSSDNSIIKKLMSMIGAEAIDYKFTPEADGSADAFAAATAKLIETANAPQMAVFNAAVNGAKSVGSAVGNAVSNGVDAVGNVVSNAGSTLSSGIAATKGMIMAGDENLARMISGPKENDTYSFDGAAANQSLGIDGSLEGLMNLIGQHESGNDYDRVVGTPKGSFHLTDMTIGELMDFQRDRIRSGKNSASGRWQINLETLKEFYQKAGLSLSDKFSPANQDKLFMALMNRRGAYSKYMRGEITKGELANDMAKTWAALPMESGRSYYDGVNGNMAGVSRSDFLSSIPSAGSSSTTLASATPSVASTPSVAPSSGGGQKSSPRLPAEPRVNNPLAKFFEDDLSYMMA